ncbi:MAG: ABC transporter substrate-binding protein [Clostridiales bacterium]|nr:ABC transporter substrate-binding protein [Clostridiales bacterium]MDY3747776.1 ABC transporter substrate-binding protein [Lachnospiraceae bacterium]
MKRKCIVFVLLLSLFAASLTGCKKTSGNLTTITLNEVAHSIFYAPMYVAIEKGYFEEEGLKITLVNGAGADKVMTALVSGEADIGFMGPEATVYAYNQGAGDYAVNFAQLTQRAGNFLVSRTDDDHFQWEDLKGKTVLGGRAGGMPQMVFEYILKQNGINPETDLDIIQNIDFGVTAEAFASGTGDYTVEFEPFASKLELSDKGYVIASLGVDSGYVPYTCFSVLKSYIDKNPETIQKFVCAIQKGLDYVNSNTPEQIAKVIQPQFKETDEKTLQTIVTRYAEQDTWRTDTVFTEDAFNLLLNILDQAGELDAHPPYRDLVNTDFAAKAK